MRFFFLQNFHLMISKGNILSLLYFHVFLYLYIHISKGNIYYICIVFIVWFLVVIIYRYNEIFD